MFLDRDNTLIANDGDLGDPEAVRLLPGVALGLDRLSRAGYLLVVVSNQGGVARGRYTVEDVRAVHDRIAALVDAEAGQRNLIARFYFCPYHPEGTVPEFTSEHEWRKPAPGMLLQAARDLDLDLSRSWMVGDAPRDMEAGRRAGCRTAMVFAPASDSGRIDTPSRPRRGEEADLIARDLAEAAEMICRWTAGREAGSTSSATSSAPP